MKNFTFSLEQSEFSGKGIDGLLGAFAILTLPKREEGVLTMARFFVKWQKPTSSISGPIKVINPLPPEKIMTFQKGDPSPSMCGHFTRNYFDPLEYIEKCQLAPFLSTVTSCINALFLVESTNVPKVGDDGSSQF